jgi:hypothetical protein
VNAAMLSYLGTLWAGIAEPFWPHTILISLSVLAAFTVAAGILYERPKYSEAAHRGATWLVIGGVAVESICTVLLFVFDERISQAQQSKIIALETRLAPRVIFDDEQQRMVERLKPYAGTPFDFTVDASPEPLAFADRISDTLIKAGWKRVPFPAGNIFSGTGENKSRVMISSLQLGFEIDASKIPEWGNALAALGSSFAEFKPRVNVANDGSAPDNAIHIFVGAKQ